MPFAVAGAAIGAGVSAAGASDAADAAQKQAQAQLDWQKSVYNTAQSNMNPYIDFGKGNIPNYQNAINQYMAAVPYMTTPYGMSQYQQSPLYTPMVNNLAELQATPGYQMQLQQGLQAINNSSAAQGGLLSGANQMALNNYAQNQAATGFQNAWQRAQTAYGNAFSQNLQGQQQTANVLGQQANITGTGAGVGLSAAGQLAEIGQSPAISNAYQNLGNANAAAAGAPYAAIGQGIGNIGSSLGSAYGSGNLSSLGNYFSGIGGSNMGNVVSPVSQQTLQSQFANAPAYF